MHCSSRFHLFSLGRFRLPVQSASRFSIGRPSNLSSIPQGRNWLFNNFEESGSRVLQLLLEHDILVM
ncbi:uncharacterized protein G2W53_006655 [Senna tora]|uniref:Uncharacterized protein n=1 Tax=Senna tora TaxID=362788 RepID=A0A834X4Q2_9FABA|nr:uncharacterized protein G2W53_006655 [Senna tora]